MIIDPYTWRRITIASVSPAGADTVSVRMPRPDGYEFRAGQYAIVRTKVAGSPLLRQFSFCSDPGDPMLELLVQRETSGVVSSWFCDEAAQGDEIELSQPFGNFTWDNEPGPVLFIAGRIGIAPFISMLRHHQETRSQAPVSVLYSVREAGQICEKDLLDTFLTTYIVTSSNGRLSAETLRIHLASDPMVYICGSKQFVDAIHDFLVSLDVPTEHIRRELFTLQ